MTLKKKSNVICYYTVSEAIIMGKGLVAHILRKKNLADLFMKVLHDQTWWFLMNWMLSLPSNV